MAIVRVKKVLRYSYWRGRWILYAERLGVRRIDGGVVYWKRNTSVKVCP